MARMIADETRDKSIHPQKTRKTLKNQPQMAPMNADDEFRASKQRSAEEERRPTPVIESVESVQSVSDPFIRGKRRKR